MYELLKKVQALAEEIGPVTAIAMNKYRDGYIEVVGEIQGGNEFCLELTIAKKDSADE